MTQMKHIGRPSLGRTLARLSVAAVVAAAAASCSVFDTDVTNPNAASEEAFRELRRRIVAEDASDSVVTDMGSMLLFSFIDPDEGRHEVVWKKPGVPVEAGLRRAEWRTVELPE